MKNLLANWKTSGVAVLTAILVILNLVFPKVFTTDINIKVVGALTAILALLSKDYNTTGGTVINNPNDASVVKESAKKDV
jgi:hypothetical protein